MEAEHLVKPCMAPKHGSPILCLLSCITSAPSLFHLQFLDFTSRLLRRLTIPVSPLYLHASALLSMTSLRSCEASLLYSMVLITSLLEVLYPHALQNRALSWFFCYVSICLTGSFFSTIPHKYGPPQCPTFASLLYSLLDLFHSLRFCPQFLDR